MLSASSRPLLLTTACCLLACGSDRDARGAGETSPLTGTAGEAGDGHDESASEAGGDNSGGGGRLDVSDGAPTGGNAGPSCGVVHDPDGGLDGVGPCEQVAPPDSFEPEVQWAIDDPSLRSYTTPLVANLTDDNGDGRVNLCDIPDIVLVSQQQAVGSVLFILDGADGHVHAQTDFMVSAGTPAIADMDEDGVPEIITATCPFNQAAGCMNANIVAITPDARIKWMGDTARGYVYGNHIAVANIDNEGTPEIMLGSDVYNGAGGLLFRAEGRTHPHSGYTAAVFADLDGDDDQEAVFANRAYHHDGTLLWQAPITDGWVQIANLDNDDHPEILVTNYEGISVLEHDGRVKFRDRRPTGVEVGGLNWTRPVAIHDFDGDGDAEFAAGSSNVFAVYERDASIKWQADIIDISGIAGGTAFDFLGDGQAEAMYAEEGRLYVYNESGSPLLDVPRTSGTVNEYPVVADVDNDGSAEIVVVSEFPGRGYPGLGAEDASPVIQVIRDVGDRWIQARRIWNQHTYHVTNVREDATIPLVEPKHWQLLNTFRTNAQIEGDLVCRPLPTG